MSIKSKQLKDAEMIKDVRVDSLSTKSRLKGISIYKPIFFGNITHWCPPAPEHLSHDYVNDKDWFRYLYMFFSFKIFVLFYFIFFLVI